MTPPMTPREQYEQAKRDFNNLRDDGTLTPREKVAVAIKEADDTFGYSSEMIRLVDGVSTRRLKINGREAIEITDGEENDWDAQSVCYAIIAEHRAAHRADAILTALASGSGDHAELARLAERCTTGDPWYKDGDLRGRQSFGQFLSQDRAFIAAANPATVLALLAENAALRVMADDAAKHSMRQTDKLLAEHDRATEAERKLAEAVGLLRDLLPETPRNPIDGSLPTFEQCEAARTFLSKEAERG